MLTMTEEQKKRYEKLQYHRGIKPEYFSPIEAQAFLEKNLSDVLKELAFDQALIIYIRMNMGGFAEVNLREYEKLLVLKPNLKIKDFIHSEPEYFKKMPTEKAPPTGSVQNRMTTIEDLKEKLLFEVGLASNSNFFPSTNRIDIERNLGKNSMDTTSDEENTITLFENK